MLIRQARSPIWFNDMCRLRCRRFQRLFSVAVIIACGLAWLGSVSSDVAVVKRDRTHSSFPANDNGRVEKVLRSEGASSATSCGRISSCSLEFAPVRTPYSLPSAFRLSVIVPAAASDATCWALADSNGTVVIESSVQRVDAGAPADRSTDASLWRASSQCALQEIGKDSAAEFPGLAAAFPGVAAALRLGTATIAVVPQTGCVGAIAPGLIFPTDTESKLPIVPRDQIPEALTQGRTDPPLLDVSVRRVFSVSCLCVSCVASTRKREDPGYLAALYCSSTVSRGIIRGYVTAQ
jgi:hypothetical protein